MRAKVVWSNLARQTLLDIYVAIGLDNPHAANRWYDRLEETVAATWKRCPDAGNDQISDVD